MATATTPNRFYFGPMTNFGVQTRRGFAGTEIVAERHAVYKDPTNVSYSEYLRAMTLTPDRTLKNMVLAQHTLTGDWDTCLPPKPGATHLHAYSCLANTVTTCASSWTIPATPSFCLSFVRAEAPPDNMERSAQKWTFTFAGGYTMEFGGFRHPTLKDAAGNVLSVYQVQDTDLERYATEPVMRWEFRNLLGNLHITCNALKSPWVIAGIGDLPSATWSIQGEGGTYAVNVTPYTFPTSGTFDTDWIEQWYEYPDADLLTIIKPGLQTGTTATVSILASTETRKRYRVTLTGPGYTTPVVQLFAYEYDPAFTSPAESWTEVTDFVMEAAENFPADMTAKTASVTMSLRHEEGGSTLLETLGTLYGQYAFYYTMGIPGGDEVIRMTGIAKARNATSALDSDTITFEIADRFVQLADSKLFFAPCGVGMSISEAMTRYAAWAGFRANDVTCTATGDLTEEHTDGYDKPPWLPAMGTSGAEWLRKICQTKGVRLYTNALGNLVAEPVFDGVSVATYTTTIGGADNISLSQVDFNVDLTGVENHILTEGRGLDGGSILVGRWDNDSIYTPGTTRYVGYTATKYIKDDDLVTEAEVQQACDSAYRDRNAGGVSVEITSQDELSTLCYRLPNEVITVVDTITGLGTRQFRIVAVKTKMETPRNLVTVSAEEVISG